MYLNYVAKTYMMVMEIKSSPSLWQKYYIISLAGPILSITTVLQSEKVTC